jgi:small subunit ribosomal protein S3
MGQKVNPISMRLQVNKDWRSKWFVDKRDYAKFLKDDLEVRRMIAKKMGSRAAINKVEITRTPNLVTVTIATAKAGVVIGRGGASAAELKPDLYAKLVAENIAHQLERRMSFRRAIKSTAAATMRAGAKGVRIEVAGRLNGAEMSRREKEVAGSVPLHTLRADIDYAQVNAQTVAGIIGVKVWIYKGEVQ